MSRMTVTIMDQQRALHGRPRQELAEWLVAALTAEPESIVELAAALQRFPATIRRDPFSNWLAGACDEPAEAGLCLIDLPGRLVVWQADEPLRAGRNGLQVQSRSTQLAAALSDDWQWLDSAEGWRERSQQRRAQRVPPQDVRPVLYERVLEHIAQQLLDAAEGRLQLDGSSLDREPVSADHGQHVADQIAEIHARWLLTPLDELRGRAPRDVLLEHLEHLDADLHERADQWSQQGQCPPGLDRESTAYRCGGFTTAEVVLYYRLVRRLVQTGWDAVFPVTADADNAATPDSNRISRQELVRLLRAAQQRWMQNTEHEGLCGESPARIIDLYRRRIPWTVSPDKAIIDHDCPLCRMAFEEHSGPLFWHLDASGFDADFAFSLYQTRDEYQEECRRMEEFHREMQQAQRDERVAALMADDDVPAHVAGSPDSNAIWKHSFSLMPEDSVESAESLLFGIGCHLAELITELKQAGTRARPHVDVLNRQFDNLMQTTRENSQALLRPVIERFCDELRTIAEQCPERSAQCLDLDEQLRRYQEVYE
jgi:hypothetical protein